MAFDGRFFTFEFGKKEPIHRWFYYKEAFSPQCVRYFLDLFGVKRGFVFDPFSGIGTTPLVAKERNLKAKGIDVSPLAVLVSRVKTRNYDLSFVDKGEMLTRRIVENATKGDNRYVWRYELFPPSRAFPKRNLSFIEKVRAEIESIDDEKMRNFFIVALISILPQTSLVVKDGGVLKIFKGKRAAPAKKIFIKKINQMLKDIKSVESIMKNTEPVIEIGDAREISMSDESVDAIITSPPYLNNIDYSKVYGLELSLIGEMPEIVRHRMMRSFITKRPSNVSIDVIDYVESTFGVNVSNLPIAVDYIIDTEKVLNEIYRVLREGAKAAYVVADSVIRETYIPVTRIVADIGKNLGFKTSIIDGLERKTRINGVVFKTYESAIILEK